MTEDENVERSRDKWGLTTKGASALGTGLIALPVLEGVAHLGPLGIVLAAGATLIAYRHGDELAAKGKEMVRESVKVPSSRGIGDRLMGRKRSQEVADVGLIEEDIPPFPVAARTLANEQSLPPSEMRKGILPVRGTYQQGEVSFDPKVPNIFPQHLENETLRLGIDTKKKHRFDPWINDLFGKGMIASAVQGSGKSMLCGLIIEQAAKCGVPIIIFDHKGEYAGLTDLPFVNGLRAGSEALRSRINCFELAADNADDFVQLVMQERHQAIIHLPSYGDAWVDRAEIVASVGQALMSYSSAQREAGNTIIPCLVFVDEAQLYIPQNPNLLPPEAQSNKNILNSLNNAYFALVSNGRSNGYTVCFATQSLTYIAKWAIKSCQIRVLMRHTEKNDLDMCGEIINPSVATREDMESMLPGTGVVFGFTQKPMIVKFDKRQSRDVSETPGIERLRQPRSVQTMRLPEDDKGTRMLPETDVVSYPPAKASQQTTAAKYGKALVAYQAGNTSCRELGAALGVNKDKARVIKLDMIRLGLISE